MSTLHYTRAGDPARPALLFLHGFMGSAADWGEITAALQEDFCCVAVDLPGHGASTGLDEAAYTMAGAARLLAEVLDEMGADEADVIGYSMGGRLALYFALEKPQCCRRLVLESASPGLRTEAERQERRAVDAHRAARITADFDAFLEDWYRQPLFASLHRHQGLVEAMIEKRRRNDPRELARSLAGMGTGAQPSLWEQLPALAVETRALAGSLDAKYVRLAREMAGLTRRIQSAILPEAGHNLHAEAPSAYLHYLNDFLKRA